MAAAVSPDLYNVDPHSVELATNFNKVRKFVEAPDSSLENRIAGQMNLLLCVATVSWGTEAVTSERP